jgi:indole-3-glycerol phosphate synthase
MYKNIQIIAEVKTESPFGYKSEKSWDELFAVAEKIGDIISIHTDPRWGGSFERLAHARSLTKKPILAKGIHATDDEVARALAAGADWVLVVGRIPKIHAEQCMIEPCTLEELATIPENLRVVWNARDLGSGGAKHETFAQARAIFKGWLCQASHIKTVADIQPGADAVLVGEHLAGFASSL